MTLKEMAALELNKEVEIDGHNASVRRVPGGWIYYKAETSPHGMTLTSVFVPCPDNLLY